MKKEFKKRIVSLGLSIALAAAIFVTSSVQALAYTPTTGTVSTDNVKVRSSASTTASQVSSLKNGDVVDIVDESTDASGYVWYKIRVNKSEYGYVRSDLITKAGGSSTSTSTNNSTTSTETPAASLPETQVTATEQKTATITTENVNVRKGAGKGYDSVGKVTKGDTVTITGEATGTDNKTWYQITFGNDKTGFVRGDLLEIGEAAPAENPEGTEVTEGGENAEGTTEEGQETQDQTTQSGTTVTSEVGDGSYSLVYDTGDDGTSTWYLYDYTAETPYRVKVVDLITAAKSSDNIAKLQKTNKSYKTFLIILAVIVAALVLGVILLALKLRETLYYEDEGEEEEYDRYSNPSRRRARDDEEEEEPRRFRRPSSDDRTVRPERDDAERPARPVRRDADAEERPVRPRRSADDMDQERPVRRSEERPARPRRDEADDVDTERPSRRSEEAPRRRAKNFIGDEDDFEFEFLDLDDDK